MYSQIIENESILQKLNEENKSLKKELERLEYEEKQKNNLNNKTNNNDLDFDIDIFKKLQEKMNKKSKILEETINKYELNPRKKINIINENQNFNNFEDENIMNEFVSPKINNYESLIFKIPSILLDNKIEELEIYIRLETIFSKLNSITEKNNFISLLKKVLNNLLMLKKTNFTVYSNLFNFIFELLINELLSNNLNFNLPISYLQNLIEFLILNKDINEIICLIILLLKKNLPNNFMLILNEKKIITIKVLLYYLKKIKSILKECNNLEVKKIFIEINELLYEFPPSMLNKEVPLIDLYINLYNEIKKIVNIVIQNYIKKNNFEELKNSIIYIKTKVPKTSKDFTKYLDYIIYKINI